MMPKWVDGCSVKTKRFLTVFHECIADLCSEYISDLKSNKIHPEPKVFQDSLWGFIQVTPAELILIDSPLIQRLKKIRQLGFAFQLFPNAGYSRFEHSVGVAHIVKDYALALNALNGAQIGSEEIKVLRLAAVLHDVGHVAFSHVSERALRHFKPIYSCIEELRFAQKTFNFGNPIRFDLSFADS